MPFNADLAAVLDEIAQLSELLGESRFRVNAYAKAARVIADHPADLQPLSHDQPALTNIDGVGSGIAQKIAEYAHSGRIADHDALLDKVPAGLLQVMRVPGLGPKTVKLLWDNLGVTDIAGLREALDSGAILQLPRMGDKQAQKIRQSLAFADSAGARLHLGVAAPAGEAVLQRIRELPGVTRAELAGSLRRGKETIGDIDMLALADSPPAVHKALREDPDVVHVIASGDAKTSVRIRLAADPGRWKGGFNLDDDATVQLDLRVVPAESWGAALMYFTGSKQHNVRLRERAIKKGLTLNEYGLFPDDDPDNDEPPQRRGVAPVASDTEEAVYKALGLPWIPPQLREDRGELNLDQTPPLIEVDHIKSELHAHTTESDGKLSLDQLVDKARSRGFHTIAITDHSQTSAQAGGLDPTRLAAQRDEIKAARQRFGDRIAILAASEVDIHADGSLDFDDDTLASLDHVVASPHTALTQDTAKATKRLVRAVSHPLVHVLGHPSGRIIDKRPGLEPAWDEVFAAAAEHDCALEVNAHWLRLDLKDTLVRAALDAGCKIAINCDVHRPNDFDNIRFGVATARRGGLTPDRCLNAWHKAKLHDWLRSKR